MSPLDRVLMQKFEQLAQEQGALQWLNDPTNDIPSNERGQFIHETTEAIAQLSEELAALWEVTLR